MQEFFQQAASKLGIGEDTAKSATGGLLGLIKEHADGADFAELASKVPGVSQLADAAPSGGGGGGGLGGMLGGITDAIGGGDGGALGALGALTKSGLSMDKIGSFAGLFSGFLKNKIGGDLIKRLLGSVPGLSSLLG